MRKNERNFLLADRAEVTWLLSQLTSRDVMTRFGLEARLEDIEQRISELSEEEEAGRVRASTALYFGGEPVASGEGVESRFAGTAITKFQDLVDKVHADETTGLASSGPVPNRDASILHITNIVRGSFGFLLEEKNEHRQLFDSSLKSAVDGTVRLLKTFADSDEEPFDAEIKTIDRRVFESAGGFFKFMHKNSATLRLVSNDRETSLNRNQVARGFERSDSVSIDENTGEIKGQLKGVLPDAHRFEFHSSEGQSTISGSVVRSLPAEELADYNRNFVNQDCTAEITIRRTLRGEQELSKTYQLIAIRATP